MITMRYKFKITEIDNPMFFLKVGNVVIVDYEEDRVYSEDGKQYMPLDTALSLGLDGEQISDVPKSSIDRKKVIEGLDELRRYCVEICDCENCENKDICPRTLARVPECWELPKE